MSEARAFPRAPVACAAYVLLTCLVTWPTVLNLTRRLPLDLGDPLLNAWILSWDWGQLLHIAHGETSAIRGFWNATIFYPQPLALAYSEHLFAQALQALPLFALTRDVLLCYNLLFLSTFALSGLGAFLFVRQLTGDARAAFVGGLLFAFAPYRMTQIGHLQVLSSQWMPFALFGLARWFESIAPVTGEPPQTSGGDARVAWKPLAGAAAALVAQNLSCGYYLVFFAPVIALYTLWEIGRRGLWRHVRMWVYLAGASAAVIAATLPFLLPYLWIRQQGFRPRPIDEIRRYSADVYSYLRALDDSIWSRWLADFTREEGVLFPGFVPVVLAAVGLADATRTAIRRASRVGPGSVWRQTASRVFAGATSIALLVAVFELFAGPAIQRVRRLWFPLALVGNVLTGLALAVTGWLACSARARRAAHELGRQPVFFFLCVACAAAWLSFGPFVQTKGFGLTEQSAYLWFYRYLPGFNGLRVAARFAMLVALALALMGGTGAAVIARSGRRWGGPLLAALSVLFMFEGLSVPVQLVPLEWRNLADSGRQAPVTARELRRLYDSVARLPRGTVVAEFPLGGTFDDVRAAFFSIRHGHPLVNGYSGELPPRYRALRDILGAPAAQPEVAWSALMSTGATCVIVHEWAFEGDAGRAVSQWLASHGCRLLKMVGTSRVYDLPQPADATRHPARPRVR